MSKAVRRVATTLLATGLALGGTAVAAHAEGFPQVGVGQEACLTKSAASVTVLGISSPYVARFQVKRNGQVLYQGTGTVFGSTYWGSGYYEFCGKNKLGNPGPIDLFLQIN